MAMAICSLVELEINNINDYAGKTFNVGGGRKNAISLLEVISYLEKKIGGKARLNFQKPRPADLETYVSDMTKLLEFSDWRPKTTVFEGIDQIWASMNNYD
ncbi:MAG: hypothetical protein DDT40_01898 [candidate division WS2 bacterium]|nr:hypothetical protein [Candidatus Psychracetigena formicireducens]